MTDSWIRALASESLPGLDVSSTVNSRSPHPDSCNLFLFWSCKCPIRRRQKTHSIGVKLIHIQEDYLINALAPLIGEVGNISRVIVLFNKGLRQKDTLCPSTYQPWEDTCVLPLTKGLMVNRAEWCEYKSRTKLNKTAYNETPSQIWRSMECV